jgi:4a-hydroxytetrahydrobiopterin dehydratase
MNRYLQLAAGTFLNRNKNFSAFSVSSVAYVLTLTNFPEGVSMKLEEQTCTRTIGTTPLSEREVDGLLVQVPGWSLSGREIRREFKRKDFRQAMELVNAVAAVADEQDHHPDIHISYNRVTLVLTTHRTGGLSLNDFILAARINLLPGPGAAGKAA